MSKTNHDFTRCRWRKISRHRLAHEDGRVLVGTASGWYLHLPSGNVRGPFQFAVDGKDLTDKIDSATKAVAHTED